MSLALLQGYSSAEEEGDREERDHRYENFSDDTDSDADNGDAVSRMPSSYNPVDAPKSSSGSVLPSALDAFSEVIIPSFNSILNFYAFFPLEFLYWFIYFLWDFGLWRFQGHRSSLIIV